MGKLALQGLECDKAAGRGVRGENGTAHGLGCSQQPTTAHNIVLVGQGRVGARPRHVSLGYWHQALCGYRVGASGTCSTSSPSAPAKGTRRRATLDPDPPLPHLPPLPGPPPSLLPLPRLPAGLPGPGHREQGLPAAGAGPHAQHHVGEAGEVSLPDAGAMEWGGTERLTSARFSLWVGMWGPAARLAWPRDRPSPSRALLTVPLSIACSAGPSMCHRRTFPCSYHTLTRCPSSPYLPPAVPPGSPAPTASTCTCLTVPPPFAFLLPPAPCVLTLVYYLPLAPRQPSSNRFHLYLPNGATTSSDLALFQMTCPVGGEGTTLDIAFTSSSTGAGRAVGRQPKSVHPTRST